MRQGFAGTEHASHLISTAFWWKSCHQPHLTKEEMEPQRGLVPCCGQPALLWRGGGQQVLSLFNCAHLSEMNCEHVEEVAIWGYLIIGIKLADENLFPFMLCFYFPSIYMSVFIKAWRGAPCSFLCMLYPFSSTISHPRTDSRALISVLDKQLFISSCLLSISNGMTAAIKIFNP